MLRVKYLYDMQVRWKVRCIRIEILQRGSPYFFPQTLSAYDATHQFTYIASVWPAVNVCTHGNV